MVCASYMQINRNSVFGGLVTGSSPTGSSSCPSPRRGRAWHAQNSTVSRDLTSCPGYHLLNPCLYRSICCVYDRTCETFYSPPLLRFAAPRIEQTSTLFLHRLGGGGELERFHLSHVVKGSSILCFIYLGVQSGGGGAEKRGQILYKWASEKRTHYQGTRRKGIVLLAIKCTSRLITENSKIALLFITKASPTTSGNEFANRRSIITDS